MQVAVKIISLNEVPTQKVLRRRMVCSPTWRPRVTKRKWQYLHAKDCIVLAAGPSPVWNFSETPPTAEIPARPQSNAFTA